MGLGPVWELRNTPIFSSSPSGILAIVPDVQLIGDQPDASTPAGALLANILSALEPRVVSCQSSIDSSVAIVAGCLILFGDELPKNLTNGAEPRVIQLPSLEAMLKRGELKSDVWRKIAGIGTT